MDLIPTLRRWRQEDQKFKLIFCHLWGRERRKQPGGDRLVLRHNLELLAQKEPVAQSCVPTTIPLLNLLELVAREELRSNMAARAMDVGTA